MDIKKLRKTAKRIAPAPVVGALAAVETYARRMAAWRRAARNIRGRSPADSAVLRRSIALAPVDMLRDLKRWREPSLAADADVVAYGLGVFGVRGRSDDLCHVLPENFSEICATAGGFVYHGDTVIDAGANIGAITVFLARRVGPTGKVIAVEMMPDTAECLRRNLAMNHLEQVEVVEQALSDTCGETVIAHVEAGMFGQASIDAVATVDALRHLPVGTTTIDKICADLGEIALIKMDLEGAEPRALRGAMSTLPRVRAVIFESWQRDGGETATLLRAAHFFIAPIDGRNFLATRSRAIGVRR